MIVIAKKRLRECIVGPVPRGEVHRVVTLPLLFGPGKIRWHFERSMDGLLWMPNVVMNEAKESIFDRNIDLIADTLKAGLATATWVSNADEQFIDEGGADDFVDGRAAGTTDQTLTSKVIGKDLTGDFTYLDAADSVFLGVTAGTAITHGPVYKDSGVATTSKLLADYDIPDITPNGGDITLQWATPANGGVLKGA